MTTEQAFLRFQVKIDENLESSKIGIDRGRFVLLFNEAQNKMIEFVLNRKGTDDYQYIQRILVPNLEILRSISDDFSDIFAIPTDFLSFSSAYSKASKGSCIDTKISLFDIKDDNKTEILQDEFNKPSFIAREAPFTMASKNFHLYKDGFTHDKLHLSYYRYPVQIKLVVEDDPESQFDTAFDPEFDDIFVDRILSMAASEFEINEENQKSQLDRMRAQQEL
jgi:hypothetical protein